MPHKRFDLRRAKFKRPPKRTFYVFCEGKNTEPGYFSALQKRLGNSLIQLRLFGGAGVPKTLADAAIAFAGDHSARRKRGVLNSFEENDEIWVVFDRDEHPSYYDAIRLCDAKDVGVAKSNPCFEIWLLLHIEEYNKTGGRREAQKRLKKLRPEYNEKQKMLDFPALLEALDLARRRAEKQLKARIAEGLNPLGAPYTTVHRLIEAILKK